MKSFSFDLDCNDSTFGHIQIMHYMNVVFSRGVPGDNILIGAQTDANIISISVMTIFIQIYLRKTIIMQ